MPAADGGEGPGAGPAWSSVEHAAASVLWIARFDYPRHGSVALHHHPHHQWFLVTGGTARFSVGGRILDAGEGDSVLVPPGVAHGLDATGRRRLETLDCKFAVADAALAARLVAAAPLPAIAAGLVRERLETILDEAQRQPECHRERCAALLTDLLVVACRRAAPAAAASAPEAARRSDDPVLDALVDWLRGHLAERIDGAAMARGTGWSRRRLAERCRASAGCSPGELLRRLRIESACRLLRDGDLSIGAIATRCGFASAAHFARVFARATGAAPGRWRARERDGIGRGIAVAPGYANQDWIGR